MSVGRCHRRFEMLENTGEEGHSELKNRGLSLSKQKNEGAVQILRQFFDLHVSIPQRFQPLKIS